MPGHRPRLGKSEECTGPSDPGDIWGQEQFREFRGRRDRDEGQRGNMEGHPGPPGSPLTPHEPGDQPVEVSGTDLETPRPQGGKQRRPIPLLPPPHPPSKSTPTCLSPKSLALEMPGPAHQGHRQADTRKHRAQGLGWTCSHGPLSGAVCTPRSPGFRSFLVWDLHSIEGSRSHPRDHQQVNGEERQEDWGAGGVGEGVRGEGRVGTLQGRRAWDGMRGRRKVCRGHGSLRKERTPYPNLNPDFSLDLVRVQPAPP